MTGVALAAIASPAYAEEARRFEIPRQSLVAALEAFGQQGDKEILFSRANAEGRAAPAVSGEYEPQAALAMLLQGTGLKYRQVNANTYIVEAADPQSGGAAGGGANEVEALIVTAQKREEDIQDVPIAMSAFSQEQLTDRQVAGGADLMTQVPNMTFTKTNFTGYSIQIRGIGTQAISATTDAAVAVALNNTPFIRNRFFEQEFYDLQRVEVLRGPQGTLYGRNATAGVVNIITAKPKFGYEAKASADLANYNSIRLEGMVNVPLVEGKVALRLAGAWTKRDGFVTNQITGSPIDGRDLWSTRLSLRFEPTDAVRANFIWEHFEEDDDRLRSGKQLCKKHTPAEIGGVPVEQDSGEAGAEAATYSQGCLPASLYSDEAFQTPNGFALPYYAPLGGIGLSVFRDVDPYVSVSQSRDLRVIESTRDPQYRAKSDLAELQVEFDLSPNLTLASETAYNADLLFSFQDFNRFNTKPGAFDVDNLKGDDLRPGLFDENGMFCDPQLGCSDRLLLADLSTGEARLFSQEFRLSSDFDGAFNFSLGGNFLRFDMEDKYYVFANTLTLWAAQGTWTQINGVNSPYELTIHPWVAGVSDNSECFRGPGIGGDPNQQQNVTGCIYVDPNPVSSLNDKGHNYFLSRNPYRLISYAAFGEAYYSVTPDLKLTAGFRWTVDKKRAPRIPSWLIAAGSIGHPVMEIVEQDWREPTGRLALDWKPELSFTDETLLYASYAHGYKAGGMNPPPAVVASYGDFGGGDGGVKFRESIIQPKTFNAEFIDAYEVGIKNTLLEGRATFNANAFYYDYRDYQLSQIINRSAVTQNFDAKIWGVEIEADWRPTESFRLGFKGGYENTRVADGEQAIDLMDRTAGNPDWVVARPFPSVPSNCILPVYVVTYGGQINVPDGSGGHAGPCLNAYVNGFDPWTVKPYVPNPNPIFMAGYPGFDPATAPNNGEGFFKSLGGNELPNAPNFTATLTADYTMPLAGDWLATFHTDFYYQSEAWTRIFNTDGYDKLKAYTNINLAAMFTNEDAGWKVMAYIKNVLDRDAITGAFLFSDDTGLATNVFLNEPRLYGLRVTKQWEGIPWWGGREGDEGHTSGAPYPFTLEMGGDMLRMKAEKGPLSPDYLENFSPALDLGPSQQQDLDWGDGRELKLTYRMGGGAWTASAAARFGRTNGEGNAFLEEFAVLGTQLTGSLYSLYNYSMSSSQDQEDYRAVDFMVGRDVRLGSAGRDGLSTLGFGIRYAQFQSSSQAEMSGVPDYYLASFVKSAKYASHSTQYISSSSAERAFEGVGPMLSWDASARVSDRGEEGHVDLDWALSAGVLFGKQKAHVQDEGRSIYRSSGSTGQYQLPVVDELPPKDIYRTNSVSVPVVGARLGVSYTLDRMKVGAGYRWDRFVDAIDGGINETERYDRTIHGPYVKLSVGFGG